MMSIVNKQLAENPAGIIFLQGSIYLFTLIAPVIFVCVLAFMWAGKMTVTQQEKLLYIAEIIKDWCCLDVFVVAYVVTLVEVERLADYLGEEAFWICHYVGEIVTNGDEMSCFSLDANPQMPGIGMIVVSIILLWMIQVMIIQGTEHAVSDREPDEHFTMGMS